jgi:hypothetical protein
VRETLKKEIRAEGRHYECEEVIVEGEQMIEKGKRKGKHVGKMERRERKEICGIK